jgi:hypothetical protein
MTARGVGHWNLEDAPLSSLGLVSHSSWLPLGSPQRSQQLASYPHVSTKTWLSARLARAKATTSPLRCPQPLRMHAERVLSWFRLVVRLLLIPL